jgi:MFS family permease
MGGFFALAGTASINDIYFVHERGFRVGLWNFAVIVSVNMTPIISGYVIVDLSWRWSFWLLAITFGVLLALVVAFFPETTFDRDTIPASSTTSINNVDIESLKPVNNDKPLSDQGETPETQTGIISKRASLWRRALGIEHLEIKNQTRIIQHCIMPFFLLRHPAVIWGCIMWSVTFTWVIIQGAVATQIFSAPPYNLSPTSIGNLIGIAPLIGAALGTFFGGWASDFVSQALAVRNKGIYEPEFRLLVIVPALVTMIIGGFGLGAAVHNGLSPIICGLFLAFINFSVGVGCTSIVAYTNDVCQHKAGEAFGLAMVRHIIYSPFQNRIQVPWMRFYQILVKN